MKSLHRLAWTALALLPLAAAAKDNAPIPLQTFWRHADMDQPQLSPDGNKLAVAINLKDRTGLLVLDLKDGAKPTVVAHPTDADVGSFNWVSNDRLIYGLMDKQAGNGAQRVGGMKVVKIDGSERRDLIRSDQVKGAQLGAQTGSRDRRNGFSLLMVPRNRPNELILGKALTGVGEIEGVVPMRFNVVTETMESLGYGMPDGAVEWLLSPSGEPRVAVTARGSRSGVFWRGPNDKAWRQLADFDANEIGWQPVSVDALDRLVVAVPEGADGAKVLKRFDFDAGKPSAQTLVASPGFDADGQLISDDKGELRGVRLQRDAQTTVWLNPRERAWQDAADAKLPGRINSISCRRCNDEDPVLLVTSYSDQNPGEFWLYYPARKDGAWNEIGPARKDIEPQRMATLDFHRIKARDGLELPLWLTLPQGAQPGNKRPAVVLVHGGPWVRGGHWGWNGQSQFLASRGYVVIEPEFRGSKGYGDKHERASRKQWGLAMQDDLIDALDWAIAQGHVDRDRVCVMGGSYGGYAALMNPIRYPDRYRCTISYVAVTEPRILYERFDAWSDVSDASRRFGLPVLVGDLKADSELLDRASPLKRAAELKIPVMLAFGARDHRVPLRHGDLMRDALRAAGNEPEWVVYGDEGHGWSKPENRYDFAQRIETFLAKHLKP